MMVSFHDDPDDNANIAYVMLTIRPQHDWMGFIMKTRHTI